MVIGFFLLFTAMVAGITYFKTRGGNLETTDGYFLGGRSLSGLVIAVSLLLTNLSATSFIGMSTQSYEQNMNVMGWEVGSAVTLVLVALFLMPRYLKQGITTIPEFIQSRFDSGTRQFVTILFLVSYIINMLPITLYSGAVAISQIFDIETMLGVSYEMGIWIMVWFIGIIGTIYAVVGGLKAVAVSDNINGVALVIGGLLVPFCALLYIGDGEGLAQGFSTFLTATPEKFNAIGTNEEYLPFSTMFTGLLLVNLYYWGTDQSIIQKGLAAKNLKEGQKGIILAGLFKVLTPIMIIIPGIMAYQIFGDGIENTDAVYPLLVKEVLPEPLLGLFAAAMMGAILSTFNGVLNSTSTLFALNIYKPKWGEGKTDMELVAKGKIFGIGVAIVAMFVAPFIMNAPSGLFEYLQTINGFFNVPIFTIIFMGYLTKRVPPIAAKVAITFFVTVYGLTQLVFDVPIHYLHVSAILFVLSCLIMFVIGKKVPMPEDYVLPENEVVEVEPWEHRFKASGALLFLMTSMYVVFSELGLANPDGGIGGATLMGIGVCAVASFGAYLFLEKTLGKNDVKVSVVEFEEDEDIAEI